ncbi:MAG: PaaI family thioesterase [Chloroflexi bacterium]|nr:PaaI family thioesterase [Chloroflexota bacterium]
MKKQPTSRMCFVCGESNPAGVHVRFYEQEDGAVLARFTGAEHHQGYPGRMHGGVITAVMDEVMGRAIMARHGEAVWGVTAELTVRFVRLVPLGVELTAVGRITSENNRLFEGSGEIYLPDGTAAVKAAGKFVKLDISKIADFDAEREQWRVRPD